MEGGEKLIAIVAGLGVMVVAHWAETVLHTLRTMKQAGGVTEMAITEQRLALAELLVIAAYADGRLDDTEWDVLATLSTSDPQLEQEISDAMVRFQARQEELSSRPLRVAAMRGAIALLNDDARAKLKAIVEQFRDGAPVPANEDRSPYREASTPAGTLHEELAAAFAGDPPG